MTAKLEDELAWLHEWTQRIDDRVSEMDEKGRNLMQRWHDLGVAVSKLTGEVDALRDDRVKKLEEHVIGLENLARTPSLTDDGRIVVSANEYDRLKRLDLAAYQLRLWMRPGETTALHRESSILEPLWEALER